jgi:hypothetical protein
MNIEAVGIEISLMIIYPMEHWGFHQEPAKEI